MVAGRGDHRRGAAAAGALHRRTVPGWLAAVRRWRRSRRGKYPAAAAAVRMPHGNIVCGVRVEAYGPHDDRGDRPVPLTFPARLHSVADRQPAAAEVLTESCSTSPAGIRLAAIDVVPCRTPRAPRQRIPPLYGTLLADRPAAGQRTMVRGAPRHQTRRPACGIGNRSGLPPPPPPGESSMPLRARHRATALTAAELDTASTGWAHGCSRRRRPPGHRGRRQPTDPVPFRSTSPAAQQGRQRGLAGAPSAGHRVSTTYYFSHRDITTASLHQMWGCAATRVVLTPSLFKRRYIGGP